MLSPMVEYALVHSKMIRKMVNHVDLFGSMSLPRSKQAMRKMATVSGQMSKASWRRMCQDRYLLRGVSGGEFSVGGQT